MGEPIHVYPDPNGGAGSGRNYVPSDVRLAGGSLAAGAAAVVTGAMGSGSGPMTPTFLFFQEAYRGTATDPGFLGVHAADARYVAIFLFFAALSFVLAAINLVKGFRMKKRLEALSERVDQACTEGPPTPTIRQWWTTTKK